MDINVYDNEQPDAIAGDEMLARALDKLIEMTNNKKGDKYDNSRS